MRKGSICFLFNSTYSSFTFIRQIAFQTPKMPLMLAHLSLSLALINRLSAVEGFHCTISRLVALSNQLTFMHFDVDRCPLYVHVILRQIVLTGVLLLVVLILMLHVGKVQVTCNIQLLYIQNCGQQTFNFAYLVFHLLCETYTYKLMM